MRFWKRHSGESRNPVSFQSFWQSGCRIKACPGLDPGSGMTRELWPLKDYNIFPLIGRRLLGAKCISIKFVILTFGLNKYSFYYEPISTGTFSPSTPHQAQSLILEIR